MLEARHGHRHRAGRRGGHRSWNENGTARAAERRVSDPDRRTTLVPVAAPVNMQQQQPPPPEQIVPVAAPVNMQRLLLWRMGLNVAALLLAAL
jgi:hypothetical protein